MLVKEVLQDNRKAMKWFHKAAEQGHIAAQYKLEKMYNSRIETEERMAVEWFHKTAEQGHAKSQFILGIMYDEGRGTERDE